MFCVLQCFVDAAFTLMLLKVEMILPYGDALLIVVKSFHLFGKLCYGTAMLSNYGIVFGVFNRRAMDWS